MVGVANQANYDMTNVATEHIVALCDVDDLPGGAAKRFPGAKTYNDFRRLLDQKGIDAVVVATPDHTHAVAAVAALKSGRHVYCEKPLTHTRVGMPGGHGTARRNKRATQIGTQIHAGSNYRRVVELVQSGAIGRSPKCTSGWGRRTATGTDRPKETPPVPAALHYDLWLGRCPTSLTARSTCLSSGGTGGRLGRGALADFGCHFMDLPHWALGLRTPRARKSSRARP